MIISLSNLKTLLKITTSDYDSLINLEIPIVQEAILNYTKNKFKTDIYKRLNTISFSSTSILDSSNSLGDLHEGDYCIEGSNYNDGFVTVNLVGDGVLNTIEPLEAEAATSYIAITRVKFPKDIGLICAKMIDYNLRTKHGVKSEAFSRYSVTYDSDGSSFISGYPDSLISGLSKYKKVYNEWLKIFLHKQSRLKAQQLR